MILKIFSVYDSKAKAHLPPFFLPEEGMAIRTFKDCINSKEHQFGAHPEDYTLKQIGTFDDSSGVLLNTELESETCMNNISGLSLVEIQPTRELQDVQISDATSIQSST